MELRGIAQAYLESQPEEMAEHPTLAELLDYHAKELAEAEHERVMLHVAACARCTRALLDLERFPDVEPLESGQPVSEERIARGWEDLQHALGDSPEGSRDGHPWIRLWPLAAVLVAMLGGSLVVWWQWTGDKSLQNLELVALLPASEGASRAGDDPVMLTETSGGVLLILGGGELGSFSSYEATVKVEGDASGASSWRSGPLFLKPEGTLNLTIPRRRLSAAGYRLEVTSPQAGEGVLTSYRFEIRFEAR